MGSSWYLISMNTLMRTHQIRVIINLELVRMISTNSRIMAVKVREKMELRITLRRVKKRRAKKRRKGKKRQCNRRNNKRKMPISLRTRLPSLA